jgi:hypothetical protein
MEMASEAGADCEAVFERELGNTRVTNAWCVVSCCPVSHSACHVLSFTPNSPEKSPWRSANPPAISNSSPCPASTVYHHRRARTSQLTRICRPSLFHDDPDFPRAARDTTCSPTAARRLWCEWDVCSTAAKRTLVWERFCD